MTTEAPLLGREDNAIAIEQQVEALRSTLRIYNDIQRRLLLRHVSQQGGGDQESKLDWIDTYSSEYEVAFKDVVRECIRNNEDFLTHVQMHPNETLDDIENRMEQYHQLEVKLMEHIDAQGAIPTNFKDWHRQFGKQLSALGYTHPEILEQYTESQNQPVEVQEELLRQIEDVIYGENTLNGGDK